MFSAKLMETKVFYDLPYFKLILVKVYLDCGILGKMVLSFS